MKILVTGTRGFTGRHFAAAAQVAGHQVIPLTADLTDSISLKDEVASARPDAVVHLAAISFVGHANASAFYDVNVIGTLNLLDALSALPSQPRRVLLASSANVYGNATQSPIDETQSPAPVNHYATSKFAMECMARTYSNKVPLFFVRPFNYTGPGQGESFLIPKLVAHFARRAQMVELGNLDVEREFNDVGFVCDVYLRLLEQAIPGETYNICTGIPLTLRSVIQHLEAISGHHLDVRINPAFVRANEIRTLCGDPSKLFETIGHISFPVISDTLRNMLNFYAQRH